MKQTILATGAAAGAGLLTTLLGGWDAALEVLLIFILMDYVTGVISAVRTRTLRSAIGYSGIMRKAAIFLVLILAVQLDRIAGTQGFFRLSTVFFFAANEGLSILENVQEMGVKLPAFLTRSLEKLRDQHDDPEQLPEEEKDD